jgi:hypothetical protein
VHVGKHMHDGKRVEVVPVRCALVLALRPPRAVVLAPFLSLLAPVAPYTAPRLAAAASRASGGMRQYQPPMGFPGRPSSSCLSTSVA